MGAIALAALLSGCGGSPPQALDRPSPTRDGEQAASARVPLLVGGQPVSWERLRAPLSEAAGAQAINDAALELMLERELSQRAMTVTSEMVDREYRELLDELASPGADPIALLAQVRRDRGLGDERFRSLLRRSAMLRALTADSATIEDREVELAMRIRYAERRESRIIVSPTEREASWLRDQILASASARIDAFSARAAERSIDASAARAGALPPISPDDPAYPEILRRALNGLGEGEMTPILALEDGFAFALVTRVIPADNPPPGARERARRELLRRKQRLEMDRLASRLLDQAQITVLDRGLAWSWENARPTR